MAVFSDTAKRLWGLSLFTRCSRPRVLTLRARWRGIWALLQNLIAQGAMSCFSPSHNISLGLKSRITNKLDFGSPDGCCPRYLGCDRAASLLFLFKTKYCRIAESNCFLPRIPAGLRYYHYTNTAYKKNLAQLHFNHCREFPDLRLTNLCLLIRVYLNRSYR